ncbi:hypothetical protein I7I50_06619 [Histoplasma capsulatum G186AR]|uniref:Uncharacterized protein n=1 Tax=Ajellomyces capsulatus TaxID=5037 RepID=A0A8H7YZ50_AJECA|nr:hypothetical protein I7I52_10310 [Histoplasma capsulatum]QSS67516.1 hypothetical protein I7I50_06619 [Histoplasma capsulatum G186AR]
MTTNNLRKHVKKHAGANVADGGWGGGIAYDDVDRALAFYKMIIANYENNAVGMTSSVPVMQLEGLGGGSIAETEAELAVEKVPLPMRKDGKFHNITLIKKIVKDRGLPIPCKACEKTGNACCKDFEKCCYKVLFSLPLKVTSGAPVVVEFSEVEGELLESSEKEVEEDGEESEEGEEYEKASEGGEDEMTS